ncbi:hypothetical protein [Caulobacter sp. 17J65-9]|uniref:hypothetical protein n=1 Tax=Caulobacter sp. 17J65-9 TaxID=2709382 RepID=UPI0013CCBC4D|nr:hypothetical protein [Caulobacter sp. 17J65-9]NEX94122.1 hypothetical protein [Caulobacter sp. 17J65-9]
MIRHIRTAVLAGAVLCAAWPAAAGPTEWWRINLDTRRNSVIEELIDQASVRNAAPGVVEFRLLMETSARTKVWADATVQVECAAARMQWMKLTFYGPAGEVLAEEQPSGWTPLPDGPLARFVCKGERDGFVRRDGYTAPVG